MSFTGTSSARAKPEPGSYKQMQPLRAAPGRGTEMFKKGEFLPCKRQDRTGRPPLPFPLLQTWAWHAQVASSLKHVQRDNEASLCAALLVMLSRAMG